MECRFCAAGRREEGGFCCPNEGNPSSKGSIANLRVACRPPTFAASAVALRAMADKSQLRWTTFSWLVKVGLPTVARAVRKIGPTFAAPPLRWATFA